LNPMIDVSGKSLYKFLIEGDKNNRHNSVFSEYVGLLDDQPACMIRKDQWKLNYYHEFKNYQLFNLEKDPHEMFDLANDPACNDIAKNLLHEIHETWSGEYIIRKMAEKEKLQKIIKHCGHDLYPHPLPKYHVPKGCNQFDYRQLEEE